MEPYRIKSTSRQSAVCDPIILRETSTTRLIFKPSIVHNASQPEASVRGYFIFQKKGRNENWIDYKQLNLSDLRADEWIQLEIKSKELLELFKGLSPLYDISHKDGIPIGEAQYVKVEANLEELSNVTEGDLEKFFQLHKKAGVKLLESLLNYTIGIDDPQHVIEHLEKMEIDSLMKLNSLVGLSNLRRCLKLWRENTNNSDEEFWQQTFLENTLILSQIFPFPVLLIEGKAYVGGKSYDNTGGNLVDFLCSNEITKNAVLIEIKTPTTKLLGRKYRSNVFNISQEISGAVIQLSNYRNSFYLDYDSITREKLEALEAFSPHCVVIAGNIGEELSSDTQRKSFELFRNNLKDTQVISFDELFGRIEGLIGLLEE
ncbi:MAG: DUF4263 domain-containing protein [candidate division Zixibacteria bacterium]|nr:DUF4263 domain-containing protein [candidate division Zixibacteria bacterium]